MSIVIKQMKTIKCDMQVYKLNEISIIGIAYVESFIAKM